ncbi:cupin-like domain-containing protein [Gymnopilus junonius]|uniref:Cupin-like domain-containing protein n=1 Tax=Gymnopilus junonius TaxID=109634 RepID=A0A9P5TTR8_GYMJU|nr:cupin-like domain-containing protein [Gymnopilus junonius]
MSTTDFTAVARCLSNEYRDLNGTGIETLEEPPSALEFAQLVHVSRPVVIKGFEFPALHRWTRDYLAEKMGDSPISVAVTPNGRGDPSLADSITLGSDGLRYFVEPFVEKMTMNQLLWRLGSGRIDTGEIHYLQSQNGNLFSSGSLKDGSSEFGSLVPDVPREIPWCSEALGLQPDAVNIWIGDERSITSIHSDPYENIYTVVQGEKHFFLLPPSDSWCLEERLYPHATYERQCTSTALELVPSQEDVPPVRWSSILDPEAPNVLPKGVTPIRVTLHPGETLYLPVGWWHYVRQSDWTIALNWWYDPEMRGMPWVLLNFLRNSKRILSGNDEVPPYGLNK